MLLMQHFLSSQSLNNGTFVVEDGIQKSFPVMFSDQSLLMTSALSWLLTSLGLLTGFRKVSQAKIQEQIILLQFGPCSTL